MGSTRLPGKVLSDLGGMPMLAFMLDRLSPLPLTHVVVATSDLPADDEVAEVADDAGANVVRGSHDDVLDRFLTAVRAFPADIVVRLTGDCPLVDPAVVEAVMERREESRADYASNFLTRTFPDGLDAEVMTSVALEEAWAEADDPYEREHVTPFIYRRPGRFRLANLANDEPLGDERWTVDTAADLAFVRGVVDHFAPDRRFGWRQVLEFCR